MKQQTAQRGFTLIELLVVIAIISILSSVMLVSLNVARERARVASAKAETRQIYTALMAYFTDKGYYPINGADTCSMDPCFIYPEAIPSSTDWKNIVDVLVQGKYLAGRPNTDPWGTVYQYDNNFKVPCLNCWSVICSSGPNKTLETAPWDYGYTGGDDICYWTPDTD